MPIFSYRATTRDGALIEGAVEAVDEQAAIERLKRTGVIPLILNAPTESLSKKLAIRTSKTDLLSFTTELSALLSAGLPLDRSLNILSEITDSKTTKEIIQAVLKSIREGSSFSDALQRHPRVFPRLYVNMVRAGESGGVLDIVLDKLTEFLESTKELKDHIFSAMIYPAILTVTGGLSIIILLTYVLPKFSAIFAELGSAMPLPTKILLGFSDILKTYWWVVLAFLAGGYALLRSYIKSQTGRYNWDAFKLRLMGNVIRELETTRFCRTLGTLFKSGVPLLQALQNAKDVINNQVIASSIDAVSKGAKEGKGIAVPIAQANVFPQLALSMIKVGEETGQLDTMLLKVAVTYEKSLKVAVKRFVSLIEPVMILVMGIVIGFIVLSMLMAIFSITELPF